MYLLNIKFLEGGGNVESYFSVHEIIVSQIIRCFKCLTKTLPLRPIFSFTFNFSISFFLTLFFHYILFLNTQFHTYFHSLIPFIIIIISFFFINNPDQSSFTSRFNILIAFSLILISRRHGRRRHTLAGSESPFL